MAGSTAQAPERGKLRLVRESFPDRPAFGTAVSRAIMLRVAAGELPSTLRLHRPGPELAFSRQDVVSPGYAEAARAAREAGFEPVQRLAGGRAAVFHEGTLALAWAIPDRNPAARTHARFEELAGTIARALSRLGVDARVGEVPGEYCPGEWSVNARGRIKLVGIGQRIVKGGAHLGGVVVVRGGDRIRDVLLPVYEALGLEWDPETTGSIEDEVGSADLAEAERAILEEMGVLYELVASELDRETLTLAERLETEHVAPAAD